MSNNFVKNCVTFLIVIVVVLFTTNFLLKLWFSNPLDSVNSQHRLLNSILASTDNDRGSIRSVTVRTPTTKTQKKIEAVEIRTTRQPLVPTSIAPAKTKKTKEIEVDEPDQTVEIRTTRPPLVTTTPIPPAQTKKTNEIEVDEPDQPLSPRNLVLWPDESLCKKNLSFVVFVHIRTNDFDRRAELRRNYGKYSEKYNFEMFFTLGMSKIAEENEKITVESTYYKDIIQGDFIDAYRNITHKQLMHLRYAALNCSSIPVILKLDDDVAWNVKKFSAIAKKIAANPAKTSEIYSSGAKMWCLVWHGGPVKREKNNIWAVPRFRIKNDSYCDYCAGMGYFYTNLTVQRLIKAAEKARWFWIDDVFITGHLVHAGNVSLIKIKEEFESNTASSKRFMAQNVTFSLTKRQNTDKWFRLGNKYS